MKPDADKEARLVAILFGSSNDEASDHNHDLEALRLIRARKEIQESLLHENANDTKHHNMTDPTLDAKIAAAEARTETKLAKFEGKLDLIVARLDTISRDANDAKSEARTTRRTIIGTGISLGALILAIAAFGVNVFGLGSRVNEMARAEAQQVYNQASAIDAARGTSQPVAAATPIGSSSGR